MPRPGWTRLRPNRDWYIPGLIAVFVAITLGPSLIGRRTFLSVNLLNRYFPWQATGGGDVVGHQACTADTVDNIVPGIAFIREAWSHGHFGNWQDLVSGGGPLGSVPNVGLYTPLALPYFFLPLWLAPVVVKVLELTVSIGGTYLFLRRFDVSKPAATLAGFIFATSGFMVVWTNWPQTRVAALIPALFWAAERVVRSRRPLDVALIAAVIASMLLAGFPAVTAWSIWLAGIYVVVRIVALYRHDVPAAVRTFAVAAAGLALGVCLSAFQLLPFLSQYGNTDLSYRDRAGLGGLNLSGLLTLGAPDLNGLCIVGGPEQLMAGNAVEFVSYIGAAALVLAIRGAISGFGRSSNAKGVRSVVVVGAVFIIALVYWSPTLRSFTSELPIFSNNPSPRLRSILGFLLAVLAGLGFDWMIRGDAADSAHDDDGDAVDGDRDEPHTASPPGSDSGTSPTRQRVIEALGWAAFVIAALVVLRQTRGQSIAGGYFGAVVHRLVVPAILGALALVIVGVVALRRFVPTRFGIGPRTVAFVAIPLLVVVPATSFFHTFLPGDDRDNFFPETAAHEFLDKHLGHDRYASAGGVLFPATAVYYGQRTVTGHQFTEPEWSDLLELIDPAVMQSSTFSVFGSLSVDTVQNSHILDRMAARYFAHAPYFVTGTFVPFRDADEVISVAPGESVTCTVAPGPLRGVNIYVAEPYVATHAEVGAQVDITVTSGDETLTSGRFLGPEAAGGPTPVPLAGEELAVNGPTSVTITASGSDGPLLLSGTDGEPVCAAIRPTDDGLRLVFADAATVIYERSTALERIRWAANSIVIADPAERLAALQSGVADDTVVLDAEGAATDGQPADVEIIEDHGGHIELDVDAEGAGYVVVADAMQSPGWRVIVDGEPAELVAADHAMVAVATPAGQHHIEFRYTPPRQRLGIAVSILAVLTTIALVVWDVRYLRRRRDSSDRLSRPANERS